MPRHALLVWFAYGHFSEELQEVTRPFCELAQRFSDEREPGREATVVLRKLLEATDAAVRAYIEENDSAD